MPKSHAGPTIILASSSPRRIDLLQQAGLSPIIASPDVDETLIPRENPRAMVARLAREKAEAVGMRYAIGELPGASKIDEALIIAADTTVVAPDGKRILGKPESARDAERMLATLSGKTHTVFTGYCLLKLKRVGRGEFEPHLLGRVVSSRVRMRKLSRADIANYVRTGEPMDKAGAYGAQSIGMALIDSITGSYANVIGLPICQLMQDLERSFGVAWLAAPQGKKR